MKELGLGQELTSELGEKVVYHRDQFHEWFVGRYIEGLTALFSYNFGGYPIDTQALEIALRQGYGVAVGTDINNNFCIYGYVKTANYNNYNINYLLAPRAPIKGSEIFWTLPASLRPDGYKDITEITSQDSAVSGRFVVFWNKALNFTNDFRIIENYADELSEIVASRFSLEIQSKVTTIFMSDVGDETINQMVSKLYNGTPFVKTGSNFDVRDNVYKIGNDGVGDTLQTLKNEYQNKIAELNSVFGLNVLSFEKASGVSETESQGNSEYVSFNANVWLKPRQQALNLLNKHYATDFSVAISNESARLIGGLAHE